MFRGRRKVRLTRHRAIDSPFGQLRISYDSWPSVIAVLDGPNVPTVKTLPGRDLGGMTFDGRPVPLQRAGRAWSMTRASRTRTALVGDRGYELRPTGLRRARLLRDGRPIADASGTLRSYSPFREIPGLDARLRWQPGVDPTDVAIGQAMVVAFGAGAPGALANVFLFWLDWI